MEIIIEFGKILLPAGLVLYAMYLTMTSILQKDLKKAMIEYKTENSKNVLTFRLQAFERICLFLERISPNNLILRLNDPQLTAPQLQHLMIAEIRNEFNHNLSQQVYISDGTWQQIKHTVEDVIALINTSAEKQKENAKGIELAKEIFNEMERREVDIIAGTLTMVKEEIKDVF